MRFPLMLVLRLFKQFTCSRRA
uniref:Uncharacterized protein n=1 Tax=Anguilla anguilla TaxID=7936 RepID=A0A0E9TSA5_ANGAN